MTATAIVKQADLMRMAAVAKAKGVCIEMEVNGKIFRVSPDIPANHNEAIIEKKEPVRL